AVAAVKYSFLRTGLSNEIAFDIEESVNFNGDSGPYLMYTYSRTRSVKSKVPSNMSLRGAKRRSNPVGNCGSVGIASLALAMTLNEEELSVLRLLVRFPEVVAEAGKNYSPSAICSYLYDLAQKFNLFYNKHRIIDGEEVNQFRLALTEAVGTVIKSGLNMLGIEVSERM
ncbi:hypothetical protein MEO41_27750, partial [Dolichospermum sp. ST_sed4]|nr:hypothetical protein [Dolichospermum sp. ST_sed4]